MAYLPAAPAQIYRNYYERLGIEPRGCHPRDILDHMLDIASYRNQPRKLSSDLIEAACSSYFVEHHRAPSGGRA
jgi:hypothetical protein